MTPCATIDPAFLRASPVPLPHAGGSKDERGTVLVVAGSAEVPGAALLAATAALRAGAGKLQLATIRSLALHLALALPEARVISLDETAGGEIRGNSAKVLDDVVANAHAVLIGPGMMDEDETLRLVTDIIERKPEATLVLDAAAITAFQHDPASLRTCKGRLVMTPHAGEMAKFLGIERDGIQADPASAGRRAAGATGGVVAMKGGSTFVCEPHGGLSACEGGGIGLGTSGSGDVLAGIIAGLAARGASPLQATQWGVFVHAEAGRRLSRRVGVVGFLAREILDEIPGVLTGLTQAGKDEPPPG